MVGNGELVHQGGFMPRGGGGTPILGHGREVPR